MGGLSDWVLALVPTDGPWLLGLGTFLSCLALPVPVSMLLLKAGGFVASGDLSAVQITGAALVGAVAGDQVGFGVGRIGGEPLLARIGRDPKMGKLVGKATDQMQRRGAVGVFLTRWLFSAVGPYVNFAAGSTGFPWAKFTAWGVAGELVWVGVYVTLGYEFAVNIQAASDLAGSMLGILAGVAAMAAFGFWLLAAMRADRGQE